ncbi:hypothetical protein [Piscirickettsia litoralis]|uniref:Uncharacterized protein n=1 Tax=Piscirickettsia litoralis TaxID=1891921 RepID=A0ABX3AC42_9GAMM|nr:hypothetical protein [Piscirickettsia litoralis]ODN43709.1 hypothetical protein BGC07_13385 [Piscirickettsia litoralis]
MHKYKYASLLVASVVGISISLLSNAAFASWEQGDSKYQIKLENNTGNDLDASVQITSQDPNNAYQLSDAIVLAEGGSQVYSICGTWWSPVTKKAALEIIKGKQCTGKAADGAAVVDLDQGWSGTPLPNQVNIKALSSAHAGATERVLSSDQNFSSWDKVNELNLTLAGLSPSVYNLSAEANIRASSNDEYNISVSGSKVSFPTSVDKVELYHVMDAAALSGQTYDQPFSVLKFSSSNAGDWEQSYSLSPSASPQSIFIKEDKIIMPNIQNQLPGWPNYVAMGSVDDFTNTDQIGQRGTADAIFKYAGFDGAGDNGKDPYDIFYKQAKAVIRTVDAAKQLSTANKPVVPVVVVYTTNASGGKPSRSRSAGE